MTIDSTEVRLAPSGHVYIAPILTAAPTNVTSPLSGSWSELGYIDEDGVSITPAIDVGDVRMWQSAAAVKRVLNSVDFDVAFVMGQTNLATTSAFFLGQTWTDDGTTATLEIPSNPQISDNEFAMVVEWEDGEGHTTRFYTARGTISDRDAMKLARGDATKFGITYKVMDNSGSLVTILSDIPELIAES